jgi:hypothetical protein
MACAQPPGANPALDIFQHLKNGMQKYLTLVIPHLCLIMLPFSHTVAKTQAQIEA